MSSVALASGSCSVVAVGRSVFHTVATAHGSSIATMFPIQQFKSVGLSFAIATGITYRPPPAFSLFSPVNDIPGALCSWWSNNTSLTSLTYDGILWYSEAPVGVITPYAVMFPVSSVSTGRTTNYTVCHDVYQLSIYASNKDDAMALSQAAAIGFDLKNVYQSGDDLIQTQTGDARIELAKGLGIDGEDAWMGFFEIEVFYKV